MKSKNITKNLPAEAALLHDFVDSPEAEFLIDPTNRLEVVEAVRTFLTRKQLSMGNIRWLAEEYRRIENTTSGWGRGHRSCSGT